ncbi:TetR/AcrR family transcriptional regulator [Rhizobium sp. BK376]|uniref:TetR/AcrR family transcriptional regulator n=1 Tax=Rhizobium sp. BK376 TaxID=2512149 RepID=UPI001046ECDB|nr:TetR/AcrR family transcriptional regulator [Rhizobium sp. BK376]TCR91222.1 TetR family transcriptional regulator [Rhizobium sp. BK376]
MSPDRLSRIRPRRQPQQERSIQRVDAILAAAAKLIADKGVNAMKMTELAVEAGVPIGSLYQYFPEKAAIVKALFDRHSVAVQAKSETAFASVESLDHALDIVCSIIDWYYREYRNDLAYLGVWLGTETDKDLLRLNIQHSKRSAEIFREGISHLIPPDSRIDMQARSYMFSHLIGASIRLAVMSDDELASRMLAEWKTVIRATLFAEPDPA